MGERNPDFERMIDENPLESTNHMIYADWLDEHGEHDEAAFRRAMGEWHKKRHDFGYTRIPEEGRWFADTVSNPGEYSGRVPLPTGVDMRDFPPRENSGRGWYYSYNAMQWPNYRAMEGDFRHAFLANRRRQQPEQLSRISRSVRKLRRR